MPIQLGVTVIYGLRDPRSGEVRYVGRSDNPELRFKRHCLYLSNTRKGQWIRELQGIGLQPEFVELEKVKREKGEEREKYWMRRFTKEGIDLTNTGEKQGRFTLRSSGDPTVRFWAKVNREGPLMPHMSSPCHIWIARKSKRGYGKFGYQDDAGNWLTAQAHRWLWKQERGPLDDTLVLDHLCENPPCVNLDHLEPKSRAANTMRGNSPHAVNARKTHCPRGHALIPENLYIVDGQRRCRICNIATTRRSQAKRLADPAKREAFNTRIREKRRAHRLLNPLPPQAPRTTCRRGHPWVPENEEWYQNARHCRQCRRDRQKQ